MCIRDSSYPRRYPEPGGVGAARGQASPSDRALHRRAGHRSHGRDSTLVVKERHLGLTTPDEMATLDEMIGRLRLAVERGVDLDRVLEIAHGASMTRFPGTGSARPF